MKKKINIISTIILVILFLVGLSVMLYPVVSDWWNSKVQSHAVASYNEAVSQIDDNSYEEMLQKAYAYNNALAKVHAPLVNYEEVPDYEKILDVSGTGIMGYVSIPQIKVELPIYHGTSAEVLNIAAGHVQGSSLPVGGENTHAIITGHRGLPSAKLFTDLDKLVVGDIFTINILNEILTYEVEEIFIVLPEESDKLSIISGSDYVTLLTCTPYGVNSHRLLIRSKRIDTIYEKAKIRVSADAMQVDPMKIMPIVAVLLLIILMIIWNITQKQKKKPLLEEMRRKYKYRYK